MWPRAAQWLAGGRREAEGPAEGEATGDGKRLQPGQERADVALLGVPAHATSLTPTGAAATPGAVRRALRRCSTYSSRLGLDLRDAVRAVDLGDVPDPDGDEERTSAAAAAATRRAGLLVAVGGDNSITVATMRGACGGDLADAGLVTLDAHHDLRDGVSNGSPVRRLLDAGLDGRRVVQLGIADWANSAAYAERARAAGIRVVPVHELTGAPMAPVLADAIDVAGAGGGPVFVDLDVDVCDRSVAPACPASLPGGLSARQLLDAAYAAAADRRVVGIDLTEVDATADAADERTVRLAALCVLQAAVGAGMRRRGRS